MLVNKKSLTAYFAFTKRQRPYAVPKVVVNMQIAKTSTEKIFLQGPNRLLSYHNMKKKYSHGSVSAGREFWLFRFTLFSLKKSSLCVTKPDKKDLILQLILDICILKTLKTRLFHFKIAKKKSV